MLDRALEKYAIRNNQLKIGYGAIGILLARIGVIETSEYWRSEGTGASSQLKKKTNIKIKISKLYEVPRMEKRAKETKAENFNPGPKEDG